MAIQRQKSVFNNFYFIRVIFLAFKIVFLVMLFLYSDKVFALFI